MPDPGSAGGRSGALASRLRSPALQALAVAAASLAIVLLHRPAQQPISGDRAYLVYMAQAVARGEPVYRTTTFGYPPLAPLLSAAGMHALGWVGVRSYLAPRFLGVAVTVLACALLYAVGRRAGGSAAVGAAAGLLLVSCEPFPVYGAANLEPKSLVACFTLAGVLAMQRRRWALCGAAMGLAATCWQPAALAASVPALVGLAETRRGRRGVIPAYAAGLAGSAVPALAYLTLTQQWPEFLHNAVAVKAVSRPEIVGAGAFRWLGPLERCVPWPVLALAIAGAVVTLGRPQRAGGQSAAARGLRPRGGGIALFSGAALFYLCASGIAAAEAMGRADLVPFLYLVVFWAAVALVGACREALQVGSRWAGARAAPAWADLAAALLSAGLAFGVAAHYRPPARLGDQETLAASLPRDAGPMLAVNAPELYVLREKPSPWRILKLTPYFADLVEREEPGGCTGLVRALDRRSYPTVVFRVVGAQMQSGCLRRIRSALERRYRLQRVLDPRRRAKPAGAPGAPGKEADPSGRKGQLLVFRRSLSS